MPFTKEELYDELLSKGFSFMPYLGKIKPEDLILVTNLANLVGQSVEEAARCLIRGAELEAINQQQTVH